MRETGVRTQKSLDEPAAHGGIQWIKESAAKCVPTAFHPDDHSTAGAACLKRQHIKQAEGGGPPKCGPHENQGSAPDRDIHGHLRPAEQARQSILKGRARNREVRHDAPGKRGGTADHRLRLKQRPVVRHAKVLNVEAVCADKKPRRFGKQLERFGGQKFTRCHPLKKGKWKTRPRAAEEKNVTPALLGWIAALAGEGRNAFLRRNLFAGTAGPVFPTMEGAYQPVTAHCAIRKRRAQVRTTSR